MDEKDYLRGNPKLKAPGYTEYVSQDIILERLTEMKKIMEDPIYFAEKYFYIVSTDGGKQLIKVYPKQEEMIRAMCDRRRTIVLSARQTGKCVCKDSMIKIKNKMTGKIEEITVEDFFNRFNDEK